MWYLAWLPTPLTLDVKTTTSNAVPNRKQAENNWFEVVSTLLFCFFKARASVRLLVKVQLHTEKGRGSRHPRLFRQRRAEGQAQRPLFGTGHRRREDLHQLLR